MSEKIYQIDMSPCDELIKKEKPTVFPGKTCFCSSRFYSPFVMLIYEILLVFTKEDSKNPAVHISQYIEQCSFDRTNYDHIIERS